MTDKINGEILGFFFGAGASIEFGIPTMKSMTKAFYNLINAHDTEQKILFNNIYQSMEEIHGKDKVDIESIMSVILNLKDQNNFFENIGDFGRFILNKEKLDVRQVTYECDNNVIDVLEKDYKDFIREKVILKTSGIDHSRKVYADFFKQICRIANCANASQKPPNLNDPYENTFGKWVFFTTNYDNSLEDYWKKYRRYHDLDCGFRRKNTTYPVMYANDFVSYNLSPSYTAMQLVKLHGSVNWIINDKGELEEHDYNENYRAISLRSATNEVKEDLMVYPLSQKELYFSPFVQFFTILDSELKKRKIWIIIGYSFRDIIIRKMFEKALEVNRSKIILIHPHAIEIKKLFKDEYHQQIICIQQYFAREDTYEEINREIVLTISNLN